MALYRYQCGKCKREEAMRFPMDAKPVSVMCEACRGMMTQVLTSPQICAVPFLLEEGNIRPRLRDHDGTIRQFQVGSRSHAEYLNQCDRDMRARDAAVAAQPREDAE